MGEGELQENFEKDALFYEGTQNNALIVVMCDKKFLPGLVEDKLNII